jgi:hypothetical protein
LDYSLLVFGLQVDFAEEYRSLMFLEFQALSRRLIEEHRLRRTLDFHREIQFDFRVPLFLRPINSQISVLLEFWPVFDFKKLLLHLVVFCSQF